MNKKIIKNNETKHQRKIKKKQIHAFYFKKNKTTIKNNMLYTKKDNSIYFIHLKLE